MLAPAMVLMAAMAVPGNGPEKVSGEVEQGLDLRGEWKVTAVRETERNGLASKFLGVAGGPYLEATWDIKDDGAGRLRLILGTEYLGIYKQEGDCTTISCRPAEYGYPTSFQAYKQQWILILHRVKPRK